MERYNKLPNGDKIVVGFRNYKDGDDPSIEEKYFENSTDLTLWIIDNQELLSDWDLGISYIMFEGGEN